MNTKLLMTVSAVVMGIAGVILIFLPQEIAKQFDLPNSTTIILQTLGALYIGFSMINWNSKSNLIGGIYSRPITIGNFTHFFIGALGLIKFAAKTPTVITFIITIIYLAFAISFGYVLFKHPISKPPIIHKNISDNIQ